MGEVTDTKTMFESCVNSKYSKTGAMIAKADEQFESCVNSKYSKTRIKIN